MGFSLFGYLLVPISIGLFFQRRRALFWATIIAIPFQRVEVVGLGVARINAFQFFGVLFISRHILDGLKEGFRLKLSKSNLWAASFVLVSLLSVTMAVVKAGEVDVIPVIGVGWLERIQRLEPLQISTSNFTQLLYPSFGVTLFYFLVREVNGIKRLKQTINVVIWSIIIAGVLHLSSGVLMLSGGSSSVGQLFNFVTINPGTVESNGFGEIRSLFRMNTLAGEPGFASVVYLLGFGILTGLLLRSSYKSKVVCYLKTKVSFLSLMIILAGSTTGYLGVLLLFTWVIILIISGSTKYQIRNNTLLRLVSLLAGISIAAVVLLTISGISLHYWFFDYHLAKMAGEQVGSGQIRYDVSIYSTKNVFLSSPILGVGYGSHLTLSLVTFLLSNVGVVGFLVFTGFVYNVFRGVAVTTKYANNDLKSISFSLFLTLPPLVCTLAIAKSAASLTLGSFWLLLSLSECAHKLYTYKEYRKYRT